VIFVHGCFWHGHTIALRQIPKTNTDFWTEKNFQKYRRDHKKSSSCDGRMECVVVFGNGGQEISIDRKYRS